MLKTIGKVAGTIGVMTLWSLVIKQRERTIEEFNNSRNELNETLKESIFYDAVEGFVKLSDYATAYVAFMQINQIWKK